MQKLSLIFVSTLIGSALLLTGCEDDDNDSPAHTYDHGSMSVSGIIKGEGFSASGGAYGKQEMKNGKPSDIEFEILIDGKTLSIDLDDPEDLATGRIFNVSPNGFEVDVEGSFMAEKYGDDDVTCSGGTFSVSSYDGSSLDATYNLVLPDGSTVRGSVNITGF